MLNRKIHFGFQVSENLTRNKTGVFLDEKQV